MDASIGKRSYAVFPFSPLCFRRVPDIGVVPDIGGAVADPPAQAPTQEQQAPPPASDEPLQTFKAEVNVVNVFFNVKDKHGMLIPNLTKDDFQVMEDGKPQTSSIFPPNRTSR